ncbi:solute carrier family 22 member 7-like isoform X1 [Haemaphysalis longicornis]
MSYMSSLVSQPNDIEGGGPGNAASVIGTGACLRDKALSRLHIRHGPFQRNAFHFGLIAAFVLPFHTMPLQIAQQDVDHWCARPLSMGNVSYEQWKPQMIPRGSDGHSNRCRMFAEWNSTSAATVPCSTWDFAKPAYGASIVERFQLVCENDWLLPVSCSMFPIGAIVALLVFEPVADRLGRKPVIKFFVPLLLASVLIALLITGLSTFLITRFLVGVAATTLFTTSFALVVEVLSPNYRTLYSMAVLLGTVFGGFITALMIWLGFEWSALQLVSVLPCLVMLRRSQSVVESPDWLVARGRFDDVEAVLTHAATLNDENLMELRQRWKRTRRELEQDQSRVIPPCECSEKLFLRGGGRNSVILYYIWTIEMLGSQAGSLRIHSLGFYPAAMLALGAALSLPAQLAAIVSAARIGRRKAQAGALGCAAIASVAAATIADEDVISSMAALQVANMGMNASSFINTLYTAEVYPTVVRCSGLGLCTAFSMAASIITQLIFHRGLIPTSWLLSAVVSLLCLSGAVLVLTLPDTKEETTLPDAYTTPRYETSLPDAAVPQRDPTTNLGTGTRPSSRSISTAAPLDDLGLSRDRVR